MVGDTNTPICSFTSFSQPQCTCHRPRKGRGPREDSAGEAPITAGLWGTGRPPAQPHANSSVLVVALFCTLSGLPRSLSATWVIEGSHRHKSVAW